MKQGNSPQKPAQTRISMLLITLLFGIWLQVSAQNLTYYHAITGSYSNEQSAAAQLTVLEKQGMHGVLIFPSKAGEVYRVSAFQSMKYDEAANYVATLKKKGYTKAWVFAQAAPGKPVAATPAPVAPATNPTAKSPTTPTTEAASVYQPKVIAGQVNYLIVAKGKNQADAQASANKLATEGYKTYVLGPLKKNDPYRVAVLRHEDRNIVEAFRAKVKTRFKDAWILSLNELPQSSGSAEQPTATSRGMASAATATNPTARVAAPAQAAVGSTMFPQNTTYHLVVASVKEWQKASDIQRVWKDQGYPATILPAGAGIGDNFRVSVYQANTKAEVDNYMERLKEAGVKETMWVATNP